jgi:biopolymer transport protein TolQ
MAVETVTTVALQAQSAGLSITHLIAQAGFVVKLVLLLLVASSLWSWAIIFERWSHFRALKKRMAKFEKMFWSGAMLDQVYEACRRRVDTPLAAMFVVAMGEIWAGSEDTKAKSEMPLQTTARERAASAIHRTRNKALDELERGLAFLATVGSNAPFVGLFGTVWGIMSSFQSIGAMKNATLAVVAPGIAEALLATAIGLVAAIPAVIFYNMYANEIRKFATRMDDFAGELEALLMRGQDQGGKRRW